jgi:hypothetical protein
MPLSPLPRFPSRPLTYFSVKAWRAKLGPG